MVKIEALIWKKNELSELRLEDGWWVTTELEKKGEESELLYLAYWFCGSYFGGHLS